MNTFRYTFIAALATVVVAGSIVTSQTAQARMGEGMSRGSGDGGGFGRHGGGGRHHGGGGGFGRFGTGLAIGLGMTLLDRAMANPEVQEKVRESDHRRIHRDADKQGWTKHNEKRHACYEVKAYRKLLKDAQDLKERMRRSGSSDDTLNAQQKSINSRQTALDEALKRC